MKKLLLTAFAVTTAFFAVNAQHCAGITDGAGACTVTGVVSGPGFQDPNTVDCAEQGVAYDYSIQFNMFEQFNYLGQQTVDSIEFVSISNLPCGLCWALSEPDKHYVANQAGCLRITGTTNDAAGLYELNLPMKAWINGEAVAQNIPANVTKSAGVHLYIRVKAAGATNCANVDTNGTFQNASCVTTGINEVAEVSGLQIVPNPVSSVANVNFTAAKAGVYTFTLTDITGKAVAVKQVEVNAGGNTTTIERNNLPAGSYFLMVNDGKTNVTRRFTVAD